jgi:hypothetical protein
MATTPTKNPGPPPLTAVIDQGPQAGAVCNRVRPRSVNTPVGMVVDAIECQRQWGALSLAVSFSPALPPFVDARG